jgi:hypothetical protein
LPISDGLGDAPLAAPARLRTLMQSRRSHAADVLENVEQMGIQPFARKTKRQAMHTSAWPFLCHAFGACLFALHQHVQVFNAAMFVSSMWLFSPE